MTVEVLLSRSLAVFQQFVLVIGKGIGVLIARLLIQQLSLEQIAHTRGAGAIVVAIQAQILFGLFDAALGQQQLLATLLYPIPCVLHTYL